MFINGEPIDVGVVGQLALANYGHFTTMLITDKGVRGLDLHLQRLSRDSLTLHGVEVDLQRVRSYLRSAVKNQDLPVIARVTVFAASEDTLDVLIALRPVVTTDTSLSVISVEYQRDVPHVKHTGLFGSFYQRRCAQLKGHDDAVFAREGLISEGTTWNIGFYDGTDVIWPEGPSLVGVTQLLLRPGSISRAVLLSELNSFQAAFATNALAGIRPISAIDGIRFTDSHEVIDHLRRSYDEVIPEEV